MSAGECLGGYSVGCRCDRCRWYKLADQRLRHHRRRNGIEASTDLLPIGPTREILLRLKSPETPWRTVGAGIGMDAQNLRRIAVGRRKYVTRATAEHIAAAEERFLPAAGFHVPSGHAAWMLAALIARGWTSRFIAEQIGWGDGARLVPRDLHPLITADLAERIRTVFLAHAEVWGPSRQAAVRMWRSGRFPADCYEWDTAVPDHRPIPGTLQPELVVEAARFVHAGPEKGRAVLERMAGWGQWPDERCAYSALRHWCESTGRDPRAWVPTAPRDRQQGARLWCTEPGHNHRRLPSAWKTGDRAA